MATIFSSFQKFSNYYINNDNKNNKNNKNNNIENSNISEFLLAIDEGLIKFKKKKGTRVSIDFGISTESIESIESIEPIESFESKETNETNETIGRNETGYVLCLLACCLI